MGIDISRRQWDQLLQRTSKLEGQVRSLESKLSLLEKRMKPSELYRIVKQQEHEESVAVELPTFNPKI